MQQNLKKNEEQLGSNEQVCSDERDFRSVITNSITGLTTKVASLSAAIEDVRLTVEEHTKLLKCVGLDDHVFGALTLASNIHCPVGWCINRNHRNTLMSISEIREDFAFNRESIYKTGGDCLLAASEAWVFIDSTHSLMYPKMVDGVLYSRNGGKPVLNESKKIPDEDGCVTPFMRRYVRLDGGCIWVPADDEQDHNVMNARGMKHRVTCVTTLEGQRVVVDWSVGQFGWMPDDIGLFLEVV